MSEHIPGPWTIEEDHGVFDIVAVYEGITSKPFATVDSEADARLIAAAPDLLAALEGLVEMYRVSVHDYDPAHTAIAKATGRTA